MLKNGALVAAMSLSLLTGCAALTGSEPAGPTTPPPPVPALTLEQAEAMLADREPTYDAALLAANTSYDPRVFADLDTGPAMLDNQFQVRAFERLKRTFEVDDSWDRQLDQVWAPEADVYPQYALTGTTFTRAPDAEPSDDDTRVGPLSYLTAWVQGAADEPWRRWAQVEVELSDVPAPVVAPVDDSLRAAHATALDHLTAYLAGEDAPTVTPDEALESVRTFDYTDPDLYLSTRVEPYSLRPDQVGSQGSVLVTDLDVGSLGMAAVRVSQRTWVAGNKSFIDFDDEELRVALGLPAKPREMTENRVIVVAYVLADDGTIEVLGSDLAFIL